MYELSDWILFVCFVIGFGLGLPLFVNLFSRVENITDSGIVIMRVFGGRLTLRWRNVVSARPRLNFRLLELNLSTTSFYQVQRGYLLRLPQAGPIRDQLLEELTNRGLMKPEPW